VAFERFTANARWSVEEARRRASVAGAEQVQPVHLLAALAAHPDTPAARALSAVGLDAEAVEDAGERDARNVLAAVGITVDAGLAGGGPTNPTFAPATKRALELALRAALDGGYRYIGCEHVLLGLLRIDGGRIREILQEAGTTVADLEEQLLSHTP
jgi:ATP-dependent Clp protease ATP-binding subunit ClpA